MVEDLSSVWLEVHQSRCYSILSASSLLMAQCCPLFEPRDTLDTSSSLLNGVMDGTISAPELPGCQVGNFSEARNVFWLHPGSLTFSFFGKQESASSVSGA